MADKPTPVALAPASRRKLSETVAEQLLEAFRDLRPGTKIPSERQLMTQLGVGRSTVREALNGLAALGLLEIRHGQGAFIAKDAGAAVDSPPRDSVLSGALERGVTQEFIEARLLVEVSVAELAAQRRTEDDLRLIESALELQEQRRAGSNAEEIVDVAAGFNQLLANCAHNEVLAGMTQMFQALMRERGPKLYAMAGFSDWDMQEHRGIYEAVRDQDAALAAERMREHIVELAEWYRKADAAADAGQHED